MKRKTIRVGFLGAFLTGALSVSGLVLGCGDDAGDPNGSPETSTVPGTGTGTGVADAVGPAPVDLGTAGNFVILAKSGIDSVPTSVVTGDVAVSPIDSTAITGFSLVADASNEFSTSTQVTGRVYAADFASPTLAAMTTAVSDMETAYTDAAGRSNPDYTEQFDGNLGGKTLAPGLYKWGTSVIIPTNMAIKGGANDTWIFQIAGDLTMDAAKKVILSDGALSKNIVWQVAGEVSIGTTAEFEGIVLGQTAITLKTGSSMYGRLLAQTAVNLQSATVTQP